MNNVLEYVNKNSQYVAIDTSKIPAFIDKISNWSYNYSMKNLKNILSEKECIIFSFLSETINFCFWGNKDINGKHSGSNEMFFNLIQNIINNNFLLNINNLINLTEEDLKKILGIEFEFLPLLEKRFELLKDTISIIYNKGELFYDELFSIKSDEEMLNYITQNFWHFDDKSEYKNTTIRFNKRAILLANDLFNLSDTIQKNIKSIDNLTGCADYALPRLLLEQGILVYNDDLLNTIKANELIAHDSDMEIEIRANTLLAIEYIKEYLRSQGINLNSIEIDNIIWNMRTSIEHSIPVHKTITIYY